MFAGGEVIEADIVVSNVDLPTTYNSMLSTEADSDRSVAQRLAGIRHKASEAL